MNYSTLSLSELKALAIDHNAIPTGDKRAKQSWIDTLELSQRWENLATVEPTTDEEFEAALSERECLGEFSDAEMEAAAVAVDIANGHTDMWAEDVSVTDYGHTPANPLPGGAIESPDSIGVGHTSSKKGATTVFASLLCILILTIQATLCIGCSIVQIAIHIKNLFGRYNPDYDIFGQLQDMVRNRKSLVPVG